MSSVTARNLAEVKRLSALLRQLPQDMLASASRAAFTEVVTRTWQDSGQAAASWDIGFVPFGAMMTAPREFGPVGAKGEKRSLTGGTEIVIQAQLADLEVVLEQLVSDNHNKVFIDTPVSGKHAANAALVGAWSFAKTAARLASNDVIRRFNNER